MSEQRYSVELCDANAAPAVKFRGLSRRDADGLFDRLAGWVKQGLIVAPHPAHVVMIDTELDEAIRVTDERGRNA